MEGVSLITTSDGSHTLLNTVLNEPYHSVHGAMTESLHVFISNGLDVILKRDLPLVRILEVGFGTGLNALLTLGRTQHFTARIEYTAIETNPVDLSLIKNLNFIQDQRLKKFHKEFMALHEAPWNRSAYVTPQFEIHKIKIGLDDFESSSQFDLIYYDAFAPNKQPDMWTSEALGRVENLMSPNGIFVTYCAKGEVKRTLRSLGLTVYSVPGPPRKREMILAKKIPAI